uniref:VHS domain-containing protein n=1 Tax=Peronospora matthiolae TaxID=2874970 RepID=A0AAV1VGU9_9STRA
MHSQWRAAPESTYASQAARWKQGFNAPAPPLQPQQQQPSPDQTDLENALVSELCSSLGSSSFPPREVLQKLLRYLHTLDHDYICELLDDKFESYVWQVKAKALSVLSALLSSTDAEFYKQYYSGRLDLLQELRGARKDMLRKRADKVYALLSDSVPTADNESVLKMMHRIRDDDDARASEKQALMHTLPVLASQQIPYESRVDTNKSPRSSSAPLPSVLPGAIDETSTAFHFLAVSKDEPREEYAPAQMAAEPLTPPVSNSAFGFLSVNGGEMDSLPPTPPGSVGPKFSVVARGSSSKNNNSPALVAPRNMPVPSAPPLGTDSSGFSFLSQTPVANGAYASENGMPAFALMNRQDQPLQQQQQIEALAVTPAPRVASTLQYCHSVFDTLPQPTPFEPSQVMLGPEKEEKKVDASNVSDPIYDPFEGLDANDVDQRLDSYDAYTPSHDLVPEANESVAPQALQLSESLREVILEIDVPPGPTGVMLDRTIPDMTVIERFVPLPSGGRGYLELHPAICPGCALISINSVIVENKGLVEVGPILAALANAPKLLRFKKLMNNGRTANPSTLQMPYVPPPLEEEVQGSSDEKGVEREPESEDIRILGSSSGEAFMTRLNGYSSELCEIEAKLKEIIRREYDGQLVADRRNQLAQLHGHVEKIQTEGIDSVILGERRPPNYEEVKQFRSALVCKANELARMIQSTAQADPLLHTNAAASGEEKQPVSAFAFVTGDSNSTANDPSLGVPQMQNDSGFRFLNANANAPVAEALGGNVVTSLCTPAQPGNSYGFSFLADNYQEQPVVGTSANLTVSQAPTSPSSSFGVPSTDMTNSGGEAASNVFAGLTLKNTTTQQKVAKTAPALSDTLTKSSHGRPMGLSDLEASLRLTALGRGVCHSADHVSRIPESAQQSAFEFLSTPATTANPCHGPIVFDSSSTSTEATSPTGFDFLRDSTVSSNTPTMGSSQAQSELQEPPASMFSFISSD